MLCEINVVTTKVEFGLDDSYLILIKAWHLLFTATSLHTSEIQAQISDTDQAIYQQLHTDKY